MLLSLDYRELAQPQLVDMQWAESIVSGHADLLSIVIMLVLRIFVTHDRAYRVNSTIVDTAILIILSG